MAHNYKGAGLSNVGSYQTSGRPYMTGSAALGANQVQMVEFPRVTKSVTVINNNTSNGDDIRVHFNSGSAATVSPGGQETVDDSASDVILHNQYITIPAGYASMTMDVKCKKIFISNGTAGAVKYQVYAELTGIHSGSMYSLTGSGVCGGFAHRYNETGNKVP